MSELFDEEINAQNEKTSKVCARQKQHTCKNVIDGSKHFIGYI